MSVRYRSGKKNQNEHPYFKLYLAFILHCQSEWLCNFIESAVFNWAPFVIAPFVLSVKQQYPFSLQCDVEVIHYRTAFSHFISSLALFSCYNCSCTESIRAGKKHQKSPSQRDMYSTCTHIHAKKKKTWCKRIYHEAGVWAKCIFTLEQTVSPETSSKIHQNIRAVSIPKTSIDWWFTARMSKCGPFIGSVHSYLCMVALKCKTLQQITKHNGKTENTQANRKKDNTMILTSHKKVGTHGRQESPLTGRTHCPSFELDGNACAICFCFSVHMLILIMWNVKSISNITSHVGPASKYSFIVETKLELLAIITSVWVVPKRPKDTLHEN